MNFVDIITQLREDPTKLGLTRSYAAVSGFLLGLEVAGLSAMSGFTEWLIPRVSGPNNYPWEKLVVKFALGENRASRIRIDPIGAEEEEQALTALFDLLSEFTADKARGPFPLRRIYSRYQTWMEQQEWYVGEG